MGFPVVAAYAADYPEQALMTCTRYSQTCPKCFVFEKLHSLEHYADSIRRFGTTDNYNTEYRLCKGRIQIHQHDGVFGEDDPMV